MDAVVDYLPSPIDVQGIKGFDPSDESVELERNHLLTIPCRVGFQSGYRPACGAPCLSADLLWFLEAGSTIYNSAFKITRAFWPLMVMHADSAKRKNQLGLVKLLQQLV
ncbi:MAG: hypothetical protein Ct9H300mP19_20980 [Dehalococcoidia bacterium]|nr:MAG: hypothetical protein Ct9H300mP19_20980 [Dehalococcoidia bacterium]